MPIVFHESSREFHLYNKEISYLFKIIDNEQLGQLYYGKRLTDREEFSHLFETARRDMAPYTFEGDIKFTLEHIKQEYPTFGCGDMRYPAYEIERENGSKVVEFQYRAHQIFSGKKALDGLPATYTEDTCEATSLEVTLEDASIKTTMHLLYTIYEDRPVITRSVRFSYEGGDSITLLSAMSSCVDLPDKDYEMLELAGAWSRERGVRSRPLEYGIQGIYSMRGCSSYQYNPFVALKRKDTDECSGEVYAFSFVYSGNFLAQVEVDNYDVTRVLVGIHPNGFRWKLQSGESFQTPEVVMVYSDQGLNKMSQVFHQLYRTRLARGIWRDKERPILINNWEATYFDFDEQRLLELAQQAKDLGIELFVMDDGWFGKRNNDKSSLGDWYPNLEKLPHGVTGLAEKIRKIGMKFGIWIEPEMVNKDSELFRQHPEWVLAEQGKNMCHSRHQYILDFSKEEVVQYIYEQIAPILQEAQVSYVKWDMNRTFSEVFSNGNDSVYQGKVCHRYILGVYRLYERFIADFPNILFESCASGGARFDPGMLYYAPQGWVSDNTDAIDRLKIQYGTSYVYPLSSMGSHVSASPNHQTRRNTPIETRANVAYFGTFGYELDLQRVDALDIDKMKQQVMYMKKNRKLIQQGTFYRLSSPFEHNISAWMVVSEDQKRALVGYYRVLQPVNIGYQKIKLQGLLPDKKYQIVGREGYYYGDELLQSGLITSDHASGVLGEQEEIQGDYMSRIFEITMVDERKII
ncbi:alpha-galactosidase [Lachnospiraceae bacterium LCP25S3_G4]